MQTLGSQLKLDDDKGDDRNTQAYDITIEQSYDTIRTHEHSCVWTCCDVYLQHHVQHT